MSSVLDILPEKQRLKLHKQPQPRWVAPMLATMCEKPFSHPQWVFERKFDGVRCLAFRSGSEVWLLSRNKKDLNHTFPELVEALADQPGEQFIVDGEIVAFDGEATSFGKLQRRLGVVHRSKARTREVAVALYLFDVLHIAGYDVTGLPLLQRKKLLKQSMDFDASQGLFFSRHRREHGREFLREACSDGWEGLIAKRADSPYSHARSRNWLKLKCISEQAFVVGGYSLPQRSRVGFGALLVGYYDAGGLLRYAGKVGSGFDDATLRILGEHMSNIQQDQTPFVEQDLARNRTAREARWIQPLLVAQVAFSEWTSDGRLRHPRFLGLRSDKPPATVHREV